MLANTGSWVVGQDSAAVSGSNSDAEEAGPASTAADSRSDANVGGRPAGSDWDAEANSHSKTAIDSAHDAVVNHFIEIETVVARDSDAEADHDLKADAGSDLDAAAHRALATVSGHATEVMAGIDLRVELASHDSNAEAGNDCDAVENHNSEFAVGINLGPWQKSDSDIVACVAIATIW